MTYMFTWPTVFSTHLSVVNDGNPCCLLAVVLGVFHSLVFWAVLKTSDPVRRLRSSGRALCVVILGLPMISARVCRVDDAIIIIVGSLLETVLRHHLRLLHRFFHHLPGGTSRRYRVR